MRYWVADRADPLVAVERKGAPSLTFTAEGAVVRLYDADGKKSPSLYGECRQHLPNLFSVNDRQRRCRIGISVLTQETPSLTLYDAQRRGRCLLHLRVGGAPSRCFYGAQRQPVSTAP